MDESSFQHELDGTWTSSVVLEGLQDRSKIVVRRRNGTARRHHIQAALSVVDNWKQLQAALAPALFAFYCRTDAAMCDPPPPIASEDDIWREVELREIVVFSDENGFPEYVHAIGGCSWEGEHGLEIVLRGISELLYVGSYEGWAYDEPPTQSQWNFASPASQAAALADRRISDEEIAELALAYPAPETGAPVDSSLRKRWWKFW